MNRMITHSEFSTPFMACCIALAQAVSFKYVSAALRDFVSKAFRGIGHSRIIEEANKLLRDAELHDSSNLSVRFIRMWSTLTNSALFKSEGRQEVVGSAQASVPPEVAMDRLFRNPIEKGDAADEETTARRAMAKDIDKVTGKMTWTTSNPASEQQHIAELEALRWLYKSRSWHVAGDLWRSAFMLVGHLVKHKPDGSYFFVVKAYSFAFVAWRAKQVQVNLWSYDLSVGRLEWRFATSFDDYEVLPTKYTAPLRMWLMDYLGGLGVHHHVKGGGISVMAAQCEIGFAGIGEKLMQRLAASDLGVDASAVMEEASCGAKMELAVACIKKLRPEWTFEQVQRVLSRAFQLENPDLDCIWSVDCDLVYEVVNANEVKDIQGYYGQVRKAKAALDKHIAHRDEAVAKQFKVSKAKKRMGPPPRWLPKPSDKTSEVTSFVVKHLPPEARCQQHDCNGRWYILYGDRAPRSISWTKRGYSSAASMAIWTAWELHKEATGLHPPWNLSALDKEAHEQVGAISSS